MYPVLLIAGISVIIFSLLGIAAMTGLLPQAQSQPAVTAAASGRAVVDPGIVRQSPEKTATTKLPAQRGNGVKTAAVRCEDCGVVESVRMRTDSTTPQSSQRTAAVLTPLPRCAGSFVVAVFSGD